MFLWGVRLFVDLLDVASVSQGPMLSAYLRLEYLVVNVNSWCESTVLECLSQRRRHKHSWRPRLLLPHVHSYSEFSQVSHRSELCGTQIQKTIVMSQNSSWFSNNILFLGRNQVNKIKLSTISRHRFHVLVLLDYIYWRLILYWFSNSCIILSFIVEMHCFFGSGSFSVTLHLPTTRQHCYNLMSVLWFSNSNIATLRRRRLLNTHNRGLWKNISSCKHIINFSNLICHNKSDEPYFQLQTKPRGIQHIQSFPYFMYV